jgi:hypothetical protein
MQGDAPHVQMKIRLRQSSALMLPNDARMHNVSGHTSLDLTQKNNGTPHAWRSIV